MTMIHIILVRIGAPLELTIPISAVAVHRAIPQIPGTSSMMAVGIYLLLVVPPRGKELAGERILSRTVERKTKINIVRYYYVTGNILPE